MDCTRSLLWVLVIVGFTKLFSQTPCEQGMAGSFPCNKVDQIGYLSNAQMQSTSSNGGNDIWGWTDSHSGREFAIMSLRDRTAFVELDPIDGPVFLGQLPKYAGSSAWGDVKTYDHYAYIVTEDPQQGIQIFDLNQLLDISSPQQFDTTAYVDIDPQGGGSAHNVFINEASGFLYIVGGDNCNGGIEFFDLSDPLHPTYAGCFGADGYTHDVICFFYQGPDVNYVGKEICIASNTNSETIVDVTDKNFPEEIDRLTYANSRYTHQAWITDDHRFAFFNDELDELYLSNVDKTRTHVMDISDLDNAVYLGFFESHLPSTDHNLFVKGNFVFQSNYSAGLRILDISELTNNPSNQISEEAFFDTAPNSNAVGFDSGGTWGNYPFYASGKVAVSNRDGLFILDPQLSYYTISSNDYTERICPGENVSFEINSRSFGGFSETIELQVDGLPTGVIGSFSNSQILPGETVFLELAGISETAEVAGFRILSESTSGSTYHNIALSYEVIDANEHLEIQNETFTHLEQLYASSKITVDQTTINLNATVISTSPTLELSNSEIELGGSLLVLNLNMCQE